MTNGPNGAILDVPAGMQRHINERIVAPDDQQREDVASLHRKVASLSGNKAVLARETITATDAAVTASEECLRSHVDRRAVKLAAQQAEFRHKTRKAIKDALLEQRMKAIGKARSTA